MNVYLYDVKKLKKNPILEHFQNNKLKNSFVMSESFNYNNNSDKFSLKKYEREIKNNLAETISEKLIFKISNIQ